MLADFVSAEYRKTVSARMLIVPVAATLTAVFCFWSVGIRLAIYLLLLPLYMLPGKLGALNPRFGDSFLNRDAIDLRKTSAATPHPFTSARHLNGKIFQSSWQINLRRIVYE